jgi:hypothetical protein
MVVLYSAAGIDPELLQTIVSGHSDQATILRCCPRVHVLAEEGEERCHAEAAKKSVGANLKATHAN